MVSTIPVHEYTPMTYKSQSEIKGLAITQLNYLNKLLIYGSTACFCLDKVANFSGSMLFSVGKALKTLYIESMNSTNLFQMALGLSSPWYVKDISFNTTENGEKQLDIHIDFWRGAKFTDQAGVIW